MRGWHDEYSIDDERYLKWFARVREQVDGVRKHRLLETYRCADEDFHGFYPPDKLSAKIVDEMRSTNSFFCIDWKKAEFDLYGDKLTSASYSQIDFMAVPCHTDVAALKSGEAPFDRPPAEGCNMNFTAAIEYIGPSVDVVIYYNRGRFN